MKVGLRKPSIKKSFKARPNGKAKKSESYFYNFKSNVKPMLYKIMRSAVLILLSLSLIHSMQSDTLYLDKLAYKFILFLVIVLIGIFLLLIFTKKNLYKKLFLFLKKQKKVIFWIIFALCLLYQVILIFTLKSTPSYDASILSMGIRDKELVSEYLSINSNNRLLYFINLTYTQIFGSSIIRLQIFNAVLIFSSVLVFLKISTKLLGKSSGYLSTLFLMMFAIIQPLYLVPYTDTYCLLPMFLSINFLINCSESVKITRIIIFSSLSAFFLVVAYLIRPSCITFIIAILIFLLINSKNKKLRQHAIKSIFPFALTIFITLFGFNLFINHQTIIKIDRSKEVPFTHFLLLGSSGNEDDRNALHGTWNSPDINTTYSGKTKNEKSKLAINSFKIRTKERGISRTVKFYWQKYIQNTDTGVVGYHRDGLWLTSVYSSEGTFENKIQQIFYEDGRLRPTFNFFCQIVWLLTLAFCLVALYTTKSWQVSLIALSLFGGLLFLELFESGGTKYLFQYIPLICLLSGVGMNFFSQKISTGELN